MTDVCLDFPLPRVCLDGGTQVRVAINEALVTEMVERLFAGDIFPAIVLMQDGETYYLADGFHRYAAAQRVGRSVIAATVTPGTRLDALWYGLGANRRINGQRMTDADVERAIVLAVETFQTSKSQRQIADQIGCSTSTVCRVIQEKHLARPDRVEGADGRTYPSSERARQEIRDRATQLLGEGKTVAEVRAETGIGRVSAYDLQRELGGSSQEFPRLSDTKVRQIEQMLRDGVAIRTIEKTLQTGRPTIAKIRDSLQIPRAVGPRTQQHMAERLERIRAMAAEGFSTRQIASTVRLCRDRVREIAVQHAIEIPADAVVGHTRRHNSNRIISRIVMDAENLLSCAELINFAEMDRSQVPGWLQSLMKSRASLTTFIRQLQEQANGEAA